MLLPLYSVFRACLSNYWLFTDVLLAPEFGCGHNVIVGQSLRQTNNLLSLI